MEPSVTRRDALRLLALVSLAAAAVSCGSDGGDGTDAPDGATGVGLVASDLARSAGDPDAMPDVVAAMGRFAGGLFGQVGDEPGNLALSPYSIVIALGMTLNGARGRTGEEMRAALALDDVATERFNAGLNALEQALEALAGPVQRGDGSDAEIALDVASALFGEQTMTWRAEFLDVLATEYGAGMNTVDFANEPESARVLINEWTAEQTHDRIPELIPQGVIDALTRLVLVNALYVKAPWETPFLKSLTAPADFQLTDGTTVAVDMMRAQLMGVPVTTGDGWRAARLGYAGGTLAMTVVLPEPGRLDAVQRTLASTGVAGFLGPGAEVGLDLRLPRWTFRTPTDLKPVLQALGMVAAFEPPPVADFSAMTDAADLYVADVLHEVFIAVDEEGTEAAAATAVVMNETAAPAVEPFVVDRPFLFVLHDTAYGTPLFVGRVSDPRQA